jgi:hypothetical protein
MRRRRNSKTNRKEELKRKKGGNEMNDLKRKEEVNERDGSVETKGMEAKNNKGLDMKGRGKSTGGKC